jgi:Ca2+-binding EF-hand superfamily protein
MMRSSHHRILGSIVIAVAGLTVQLAHAQEGRTMDAVLEHRFKAANTTNDGKLTLEQAKAGMPRVAKNFDKIDTEKNGYVTLQQVKDAMKEGESAVKK